jgi:APA family basic amino acid/polyamine antiporter
VWLYVIIAFVFGMSVGKGWHYILQIVLAVFLLTALVILHFIPQVNKPIDTYNCPLVPLIPCLGILGNFLLISMVELETWIYLLSYILLGIFFYLTYGYRKSKLNRLFTRLEKEQYS